MQGEDVYTALDFSVTGGKPSESSKNVATVQCPRWHRIAIGAGGALCTVLTGVMVAVSIWAFQCSSQRRSTSTTPNQQDMVSLPDRCHCSETQITTTATLLPVSDVCSEDWVFFSGMCYFISNEYLDWNSSREDCLSMESQLLVIDDHKEMDFITNITRNKNFLWIGLQVKTLGGEWTWVNGLVLNQHMFSVHSAPEETSCGTAKRGSLNSESCRSKLNWICEKTAGMP